MANSVEAGRTSQTTPADRLADRFLQAWVESNGVSDSRVEVLAGQGCFVILIEGAFTEAERQLARREQADNPLRQYLNGLMGVIGQEVTASIGEIAGRPVRSIGTDVNFEQGWVLWYVKLGDPHL